MSFILDALKKSESDRQRQSGPALFEVKVTPPRPRFPYWALALAALLVINIVIGAWVFLRHPPTADAPVSAAAPAATAAPLSIAAPAASIAPPIAAPAPAATAPVTPAANQPEPVLSDAD